MTRENALLKGYIHKDLIIATTQAVIYLRLGVLPMSWWHRHKAVGIVQHHVVGQWTARTDQTVHRREEEI